MISEVSIEEPEWRAMTNAIRVLAHATARALNATRASGVLEFIDGEIWFGCVRKGEPPFLATMDLQGAIRVRPMDDPRVEP